MASKPKKSPSPIRTQRDADTRRYTQAEEACRSVDGFLAALARDGVLEQHESARQYAQMANVYYKKIRNGRVMGPADFNLADKVCEAAEHALQRLAPVLSGAHLETLQHTLRQAQATREAMRQLKRGNP